MNPSVKDSAATQCSKIDEIGDPKRRQLQESEAFWCQDRAVKREVARIVRVVAATAVVTLGSGCASGSADDSNTPRITLGGDDDELSGFLLTRSDVTAIDGLEQTTVTEFNEAPLFENPDPRGPCGGVVPAPDFTGAVGRVFAGSSGTLFTLVLESDAKQQSYLRALQADVREVCESHESTTNTGQTQTVSDVSILQSPVAGIEAIGWTSKIEVGEQTGYGGVWLIEADGRVAYIQFLGVAPLLESAMVALAQGAYERLSQ
jgi:hypothetical protein